MMRLELRFSSIGMVYKKSKKIVEKFQKKLLTISNTIAALEFGIN